MFRLNNLIVYVHGLDSYYSETSSILYIQKVLDYNIFRQRVIFAPEATTQLKTRASVFRRVFLYRHIVIISIFLFDHLKVFSLNMMNMTTCNYV